jgi:hypothetical protein
LKLIIFNNLSKKAFLSDNQAIIVVLTLKMSLNICEKYKYLQYGKLNYYIIFAKKKN